MRGTPALVHLSSSHLDQLRQGFVTYWEHLPAFHPLQVVMLISLVLLA